MTIRHPNPIHAASLLLFTLLAFHFHPAKTFADDDVSDLLNSAKPVATAPAPPLEPSGPQANTLPDALGTMKPKPPAGSREGTITVNDGHTLTGPIWTTLDTPLRVWIEETKSYMDIDLSLLQRIDVHILSQTMEDDWRWLKEGSDQKIFSGKKYPLIDLAYQFTLINGQKVEGTVVAPIYVLDKDKKRALALYKKYKGKLDETMADVVFIKTIVLQPPDPSQQSAQPQTTRLPLLY